MDESKYSNFKARPSADTLGQAMDRRRFIGVAGLGMTILVGACGRSVDREPRLTLLHTNDTHSRMDPFPMDGSPNQGRGGVARRKTLIDRIRNEAAYTVLLDSGDLFQGTPYYNLFGGKVEVEAMNRLGYDLATIGNHEFDNGIPGLLVTAPLARFGWVTSNLDWSGQAALAPLFRPWRIVERGPFKIGVFGLICRLQGMVNPAGHEGVLYLDPVDSARRAVEELRDRGCNLIVCLSHLGYETRGDADELRDDRLPGLVGGIDLILGGHSHTFIDELVRLPRRGGGETFITQQGFGGLRLGRVEVSLRGRGKVAFAHRPLAVG